VVQVFKKGKLIIINMKTFIMLVVNLLITSFFALAANITSNVATIDITPPLEMKYTLGGYGERMNKPAEGIHDRIMAKVLTLKKGNRKYAIVTIDILGLPSNVKTDLIKRMSGSGWTMENVMLLPSHSHGSLEMNALNSRNALNIPQIGIYQPELLEFLLAKLQALINDADRNYQPVKIGTQSTIIDGMNRNRRKDPELDKELIVTRVDLLNGKPLAALVNWTAHPTIVDGMDMLVTAEWPGYLQTNLQDVIGKGVTVLYYNGAEGDQSYVISEQAGRYGKIQIYGRKMAEKAFSLWKEIVPSETDVLNYSYNIIKLPDQKAHPSFMKTGGEEYGLNEQSVRIVLEMLCPKEVGLGAIRMGDLVITAVPGEMTAILGMKIKQTIKDSGIKHAAIGGLASEWISYILSHDQYVNGEGYESSMSFYGPDLGELLSAEVIKTGLSLTRGK
jgi:neutral ceramidase